MRSVKIVIMVPALSDTSRPPNRIRINVNPYSQNPSKKTSNLPSARLIAREVLRLDNPINQVFQEIASNYNLPQIDAMPTSLLKSFKVLSEISKVLSKLPDDERSDVKAKLLNAFREFYQNNLNLPSATAESSAAEMANALTNGPKAVLNLKNLVKETPLANQLGRDVMRLLNSKHNNDIVLANNPSQSGRRAEDSVNPTPAKQPSYSGRRAQDLSLHQAA
ncbi:MAG: hypothetical protein RLZZ361_343 [Cyanobacteriota bacterium]|jgi:hypothetical protein